MEENKLLTVLVVITLLMTAANLLISKQNMDDLNMITGLVAEAGDQQAPPQEQKVERFAIKAGNDPVKGDSDAPVTIIEFGDYECPYCGRFYTQTLPEIEKEYIDTGKVKIVYKEFPLKFHKNAQKASEAAECAAEQGKFWEYHDVLYKNQRALSEADLKRYAKDLGLNTANFNTCLNSARMASEVSSDINEGGAYGVSGTPAFFINGIRVSGAQPFQVFKSIIDEELQ